MALAEWNILYLREEKFIKEIINVKYFTSAWNLFIHPPTHPSTHPPIHPSNHLFIHPFTHSFLRHISPSWLPIITMSNTRGRGYQRQIEESSLSSSSQAIQRNKQAKKQFNAVGYRWSKGKREVRSGRQKGDRTFAASPLCWGRTVSEPSWNG